jgi:hypothetical protein
MTTTPKNPADVNLAEITVAGLSYPDSKKADRRRGFCACCGRSGFLLNKAGRLSRHGFVRPRYWGTTMGECPGSHMTPQETVAVAIDLLNASLAHLDDVLATDLVAYTIKFERDLKRKREARNAQSSFYVPPARGSYERKRTASEFRALRALAFDGVERHRANASSFSVIGEAIATVDRHRRSLEHTRASQQQDLANMKRLQAAVAEAAA